MTLSAKFDGIIRILRQSVLEFQMAPMINAFIPDAAATLKDEFSNWIKEKKNDSYYIENVKAKFMEVFGNASSVTSPFEKFIDIGPKLTDRL